jgi:hypothetical protein
MPKPDHDTALSAAEQFLIDNAIQKVGQFGPSYHSRDLATGHLVVERAAPGHIKWAFTARRRATPRGPLTLPDMSGEWHADQASKAAPSVGPTFIRG